MQILERMSGLRPLEQAYPYLIIDATYLHVRSGGQVSSEAVLIVSGIAGSGHRDILSIDMAHTETEATYADLFKDLKKRGLTGGASRSSLTILRRRLTKVAIKRHFQGARLATLPNPFSPKYQSASHRPSINAKSHRHSKTFVFNAPDH